MEGCGHKELVIRPGVHLVLGRPNRSPMDGDTSSSLRQEQKCFSILCCLALLVLLLFVLDLTSLPSSSASTFVGYVMSVDFISVPTDWSQIYMKAITHP